MAGLTKSGVVYDARGLVEPDPEPPMTAVITGDSAVIDATELTTRKINLELKRIIYDEGVNNVTIENPGSKHSLAVGILKRCTISPNVSNLATASVITMLLAPMVRALSSRSEVVGLRRCFHNSSQE